jgi:hypothetical protein
MKVKIQYKKKHQFQNLISGLIWTVFGVLFLLTDEEMRWTSYAHFILAILYLTLFFVQKKFNYLTIKDGYLYFDSLFKKKIKLSDITWIKKFPPDYILVAHEKESIINTALIKKESLAKLEEILGKLDLPPQKTPFH